MDRQVQPYRVSVFIDGANFYYIQNKKLGFKIDPKRLRDYIERAIGHVVQSFYYVGVEPSPAGEPPTSHEKYLNALGQMGFVVEAKPLKIIRDEATGNFIKKANLDVEMVLDITNTVDHYDIAVLVSGDVDFQRCLEQLRAKGKQFYVLSTEGIVAREIRQVTGQNFIDLRSIRAEIEKSDTPKS